MAQSKALDEAQKKRAAAEAPLEALIAPYKTEALRRARRHAAGRRAGHHPQAGEGPHRRGAEDRRRLFPGAAHRCRQDPGGHAAGRPKKYKELQAGGQRRRGGGGGRRGGGGLPAFWTVEVDRAEGAGDELHPDQRRSRAAGEGQARGARLAVRAREDRFPRWPDRSLLRLADRARESDVRARGRQSPLAMALRRRLAKDLQRFRQAGRHAHPTRSCSTGWRPNSWRATSA